MMNKILIGERKTDTIELLNSTDNYFSINRKKLLSEIMTEGLSLREANNTLYIAEEKIKVEILEQYLLFCKEVPNV